MFLEDKFIMRIAIMGQAAFGAKVLETLADRGEKVIAAWLPQGKAGAKPDPIKVAADRRRIPVYQPESYRSPETLREFQVLKPDLLIMAFVTDIIPPAFIETPRPGGRSATTLRFSPDTAAGARSIGP